NSSNDWNIFAVNITNNSSVCPPTGPALCIAGSDSDRLKGALGGIQIGQNWQTGHYVFGIEIDFDATGQRGDQTFYGSNGAVGIIAAAPASAAYTERLPWLGTFRGRVGIASDRTLFYATGGLAYGEVKNSGSAVIAGGNILGTTGCTAPFGTPGATCPLA